MQFMLERPRCAVWAPMGAGKTSITLSVIDLMFMLGMAKRVLVLGPLRVIRSVWGDEALEWSHLGAIRVSPIIGNETQRVGALRRPGTNVWTLNYEQIPWIIDRLKNEPWPFDVVIADESVKLKGYRTKQGTMRARHIAQIAFDDLKTRTIGACRWINLTGLPAPNGLIDLWGQTWFLDRGARLGDTFESYKQRWFDEGGGQHGQRPLIPKPFAQQQIIARLTDICMAVDLGFPVDKPVVEDIWVDLPTDAAKQYRDMERKMYADIRTGVEEKRILAFNSSSMTMKCRQLAGGAIYIDKNSTLFEVTHDEKIAALESIVNEAGGMPVLVFYHFQHDLPRLKRAFPKGRVLDKEIDEDDWNAGRIPVMFMHPGSAGHGLNLQHGGNICVFFAVDYAYDPRAQAIERIGPLRQLQAGFKRNVFVYNILARNTIDELIIEAADGKRDINDLLLEAARRAA